MIQTYCLNLDCPQEIECERKDGSVIDYNSWSVYNCTIFDGNTFCDGFVERPKCIDKELKSNV